MRLLSLCSFCQLPNLVFYRKIYVKGWIEHILKIGIAKPSDLVHWENLGGMGGEGGGWGDRDGEHM